MPFLKRPSPGLAVCAATIIAALLHGPQEAFAAPTVQRVSITSDGTPANGDSDLATVSPDGRFVAFHSRATNLVVGDTNGVADIFVHDRLTRITTRESVSSGGVQGNGNSFFPSISADGRYVAFYSMATNLAGVTVSGPQVYVRDRASGVTVLASVSSGGVPADARDIGSPSISADGRFVSFDSAAANLVIGDTNGSRDIFTRDLLSGTTTRDSVASDGTQADSHSFDPSLSSDGRYLVFRSFAHNLVTAVTGFDEVFVRDRLTGQTTLESVSSDGVPLGNNGGAPTMGGDGRFVAFMSPQSQTLYLRDRQTAQTVGSPASLSALASPKLSPDGRYLTFGRGLNIAVYDRLSNQYFELPNGSDPVAANSAVAFSSWDGHNGAVYIFAEPLAHPGAPGTPTGLAASSSGSTVTLTWSAPATGGAPTSYILEAGSQPGLADLASIGTGTTATSFSAGGVSPRTYYVRVRALNANGTSAPSDEVVLFVGANCPGPGAPSNLSPAVFGSTVTLTWAAGAGATSYRLLVGSATGRNDIFNSDLGSSSTSLFATNVSAATYFARLQSLSACGQSAPSNEALIIVR